MLFSYTIVTAKSTQRENGPMKSFTGIIWSVSLVLATSSYGILLAAEEFTDAPPPPIVLVPDDAYINEAVEPDITIIQKQSATHEEYRINGRLYMVKVTPSIGPSYYFLDHDGDGLLETKLDSKPEPIVPQWLIFSW